MCHTCNSVSARIKLKIPRKKQYDWKTLSTYTSLQEKYEIEVRSKLKTLRMRRNQLRI